jgi:hypothetical protein
VACKGRKVRELAATCAGALPGCASSKDCSDTFQKLELPLILYNGIMEFMLQEHIRDAFWIVRKS